MKIVSAFSQLVFAFSFLAFVVLCFHVYQKHHSLLRNIDTSIRTPTNEENYAPTADKEEKLLAESDMLEMLDIIVEQAELRASVDGSMLVKPPETSEIFIDKVMRYCVAQRHDVANGEVRIDPSKDFYEEAIREAVLLHPPKRYALFLKAFESTKSSPSFGYAKQLQQDQDYVRKVCREMYTGMDNDPIAWGALSQADSSSRVSVNDNNVTIINGDENATVHLNE